MPHQNEAPALRTPEELLAAQHLVLEMIATGRSLEEVLHKIVWMVEAQDPSAICAVFLLQPGGLHVRLTVSSQLPDTFTRRVQAVPIDPLRGACGSAIYHRRRVVVEDTSASPLYEKARQLVLGHGLRSCWCAPILSSDGGTLGGLGVYHTRPHIPGVREIERVESAARLAGIAVERDNFQRSLHARMEHFRALVENASDIIYILDVDGVVRYVNPSIEAALGFAPSELAGRPGLDLAAPGAVDQARAAFRHALEIPGPQPPIELRFRHKAGLERVFDVTVNNQLADPIIAGVIHTARDITGRKAAEQELISSKESYRELVENASDIVYTHDLAGNIASLNKAGEIITGYTRKEALGCNISEFVAPEYKSVPAEMTRRQLGGESRLTYDLEILGKQGSRSLVEVSSRLIFDRGRPVAVQGIARDVTEQRQYQRHLLQSQKMEAIGRLAGGVAHDFNNLLTIITGYTQWMLEMLPSDSPLVENAAEILLAAGRGAALTNQLLSFARSQRIEPILVDLNALVANLDQMLHRIIGEDIEIATSTAPDLWLIKADPGQLEQIVLNLVVNARDAMPKGGLLRIATANVSFDTDSDQRPPDRSPGDYVVLSVTDTGAGIDDSIRPHIFEPFFTTKEIGKGTGLGLSTVYGIVRHGGGWVDLESAPHAGATFRVYLPRATGDLAPAVAPRRASPARGTETILLVEDETSVRRLVAEMLLRLGYTVLDAADAAAAYRAIEQHPGHVDLLLTDVVMPQVGGPELARRLRSVYQNLKVLFISGYAANVVPESGAGYLPKPFSADALAAKLREILDGAPKAEA